MNTIIGLLKGDVFQFFIFFLNLKLLHGDFERVIDFPLFFSEAVEDLRDAIANTNTFHDDKQNS